MDVILNDTQSAERTDNREKYKELAKKVQKLNLK